MKRSKHSLSHYKLLTCDMGLLVPCGMYHVLPGDTVQQQTSLLLRCSPLMAPVMHPISVRVHHWFVPYRILWDGWEDFITGQGTEAPPQTTPQAGWNDKGTLWDYFGLPVTPTTGYSVNDMPFRAYNMIWNEFYRDQDLQPEIAINQGSVLPVSWEKDYFTTCRPWPQKGPEITLPLGLSAPVLQNAGQGPTFNLAGVGLIGKLQNAAGTIAGQASVNTQTPSSTGGVLNWADPQLYADLSQASAVNVNDVRKAFALQRWQEARAQYGSRYTEYLAFLGVRSSDARLQRPEYLGGGKATISFSEVLKTGSGEDPAEPIGTLKGHGISAMRSRRYRRFFEEHGVVLSLLSVRPRTMYVQGVHREWTKQTKEDYWQRELELIGQQEVYNHEVYGPHTTPGGVFGYQDRYSEYRHHPSSVSGDFRDTLNYWHLARSFASEPALNADFIECDPGKRIFAEQTANSLWLMASHSIQARRLVTKSTIGRII